MAKSTQLIICVLLLQMSCFAVGPYKTLASIKAQPDSAQYVLVELDSTILDTLTKYAPELNHIAGLAFIGEPVDESQLWNALNHFRMLEQLIFLNNNLQTIQTGGTSSTLKSLWIKGSPHVSIRSLNQVLEKNNFIQHLAIDSLRADAYPTSIAYMNLLTHLQLSNTSYELKYLVKILQHAPRLEKLELHNNEFQMIDKSIKKLTNLNYLNLSGNSLSELPSKFEKLENLDTLILNTNNFDDKEALAEVLKSIRLKQLVLDPDSASIEAYFSYLLPGKKITWSAQNMAAKNFDLPQGSAKKVKKLADAEEIENGKARYVGELGKKEGAMYSPAYLVYEKLAVPNPFKDFDTLSFATRYKRKDYAFTTKLRFQNYTEDGYYYPLKYDKNHNKYYKKKKLKKVKHYKQSYVQFSIIEPPKNLENLLIISIHIPEDRKDLDAFRGIVWEPVDYANAEGFQADFITQKAWLDLRFSLEPDGETFKVLLKSRFKDEVLYLKPRLANDLSNEEKAKKAIPKMISKYEKSMVRLEKKFNKDLARDMRKEVRKDRKNLDKLWGIVESYMSEEELKMSHAEWVLHYEAFKASELAHLESKELKLLYLTRFLTSQGFQESAGNDFYVGQKWQAMQILRQDSTPIFFDDFCLIDLDRKLVKHIQADSTNKILTEPFHAYLLVGRIQGTNQLVYLQPEQTNTLFKTGKIIIRPEDLQVISGTNSTYYRNYILPVINKIVY